MTNVTTAVEELRALKDTIPEGAGAPHRHWNDIFRDGQRSGIDLAIKTLTSGAPGMSTSPQRLIDAARAVLDHRYQMGAPMLPVHNDLETAIREANAAPEAAQRFEIISIKHLAGLVVLQTLADEKVQPPLEAGGMVTLAPAHGTRLPPAVSELDAVFAESIRARDAAAQDQSASELIPGEALRRPGVVCGRCGCADLMYAPEGDSKEAAAHPPAPCAQPAPAGLPLDWYARLATMALEAIEAGPNAALLMNLDGIKEHLRSAQQGKWPTWAGHADHAKQNADAPRITWAHEVDGPWRLELNGVTLSTHELKPDFEKARAALMRAFGMEDKSDA